MKIAYLYNRPVSEGENMGCGETFADYKETNRSELILMMEGGGVRDGDTLCLRALTDLGQGAASKRHQNTLAQMGVTIEIIPAKVEVKRAGRKPKFNPTGADREYLCNLWYSPAEQSYVLKQASKRMGFDVQRDKLNYICGPRDGSKKPKPKEGE
jgi:hypothetical protein